MKRRPVFSDAWCEVRELIIAARWHIGLGMVLMICNRAGGLGMLAPSKYLIDEVVVKKRGEMIGWVALVVVVSILVEVITMFLLSQVLGVTAQRTITEMRTRVMAKVARLPIRYFDSNQIGKLISRIMDDAEGIRRLIGQGSVQLTGSLITAFIALGMLFWLNWKLTSIMIVILLVFCGVLALALKKLRPWFRERSRIYSEITGRLGESLAGIRIVKAYTAEKRECLVFARGVHRLFRSIAKTVTLASAIASFSSLVVGAIAMVMIIVGGRSVIDGSMTLGDLFMYIAFTALMTRPVIETASIGTQITEAFAGIDRIREILNLKTEDDEDSQREPMEEIRGEIEFENVNFEYNEGVPVLKNVSFKSPAGSTTALVGASGSGKSTLISLVMSFNKPISGQVKIDGRDLGSVKLRDYRDHLGVILQDDFIFDGTIEENICFSNPRATYDQIREVSRIAYCDEFIAGFDKQYKTIVGERGVKLSGGQRQRIAIARALLNNPKILILDEATSSLDSESEAMIQEGLRRLRSGRTTFVIAHRLSTIRSADQILVLEDGEIVECGLHHELLALHGRYRQLYDMQYKFEHDLCANQGEDFTFDLPKIEIEQKASSPSNSAQ